jgi:hypothetical protein
MPQPATEIDHHLAFDTDTEARFLVVNRDRAIEATGENVVEPSTAMSLATFRMTMNKEMSPRYRSKIVLNLVGRTLEEALEEALLIYQPNRIFTFVAGKSRVLQGGYESIGYHTGVANESLYASGYFPFRKRFAPAMELHTQANGDLTIQLTEDVTNKDRNPLTGETFLYFSNVQKQPAVIIQWVARFGKIVPLLQIGSYDLHHSSYVTGGVEFNLSGWRASFDLSIDNRAEKINIPGSVEPKALNNHLNNKVFQVEYASVWQLIPFIKWSSFDIRQPDDVDLNRIDLEANSTPTSWDDNQSNLQVGVHDIRWGTELVPFLAYSQVSGTFYRTTERAEIDTRAERFLMGGVTGKF